MLKYLDPDQDQHSVGPDLGANCLQRLSADDKKESLFTDLPICTYSEPAHKIFVLITLASRVSGVGLPWSGNKVWKMKNFPGQGKVREFHFQSGKFRRKKTSRNLKKC